MLDDIPTLFQYSRWADERIAAVCRGLTVDQYTREPIPGWASIRSTVVHIAGATDAWLRRFRGETVTALLDESKVPKIDDLSRLNMETYDGFAALLAGLPDRRMSELWTYANLQGQLKTVPYWAALRHVVNHASYHRGQVAAKLKRIGVDPPSTDLIVWGIEIASRA